jgi:hypothetical protein
MITLGVSNVGLDVYGIEDIRAARSLLGIENRLVTIFARSLRYPLGRC